MKIEVLGTGCTKCKELDKRTREVVREMDVDVAVEYVSDIKKIMEYHILATPGLAIDGKLVSSGKLPDKVELRGYISSALAK